MKTFRLFSILALLSFSVPAQAASTEAGGSRYLGTFGYWRVFQVTEENNNPVCYMSLTAKAPDPSPIKTKSSKAVGATKRGDITLMITHRPSEGSTDVVSYAAGTKLKSGSEAKIEIEKKSFTLFTQNDTAWSRDAATDHALAKAIANGATLSFIGEAATDKLLADSINLKGAEKAYYIAGKACGLSVKDPEEKKKSATPTIAPTSKKKKY